MNLFGQMQDTHHIRAIQNRISSLVKQQVIDEQPVFFDELESQEQRIPRMLATLEELARQKRFSGLESSVRRVCELIAEGRVFNVPAE